MYKEKIVDTITGEETFRDYSQKEIAEVEANKAEIKKQEEEMIAKSAQRQALLDKLGITEEEARLLLGGN